MLLLFMLLLLVLMLLLLVLMLLLRRWLSFRHRSIRFHLNPLLKETQRRRLQR
jgi:hypothetical protein